MSNTNDYPRQTQIDITHEKDGFGLSGIRKAYAWQPAEIIEEYNKVVKGSWQETSESYISYMKELFDHRLGSVEADLFSAGCFFFYFLMKGLHPFGQSTEIPTNILDDHPENFRKMSTNHYACEALQKMIDYLPEKRGTLKEVIQLFENERKRELYDICYLRRPEEEDIALMGRLIADEDQVVGINDPNEDGYTPLILLVRNNLNESLFQSIRTLFDSMREHSGVTCADVVNQKDLRGNHPIHYLALNYRHSNLFDIVQLLCEKGLDLTRMDEKRSVEVLEFLCHGYSHSNLLDIIELLFKHGLNVRKEPEQELVLEKTNLKRPRRDFERPKTILAHLCHHYKHDNLQDIVQLLCEKGLDLKGMDEKQSAEILGLLCLGYDHPNLLDIIELLFKHGLNVRKTSTKPEEALDLEKTNSKHPRRNFDHPKPALEHLCGRYKHENLKNIVQLLIDNGIEEDHSSCPAGNPNCDVGKIICSSRK